MAENATALATLIFAAMAGIGSLIRVYQNERLWKHHKRYLAPPQSDENGTRDDARYFQE